MNMNNSQKYKRFFHFILLGSLILVCYSNTFNSSWHFDDIPNITENKNIQLHIHNLSWEKLKKVVKSDLDTRVIRPVASYTFAINYIISQYDTWSYHIVNICIHLICAFIVYLVFWESLNLISKDYHDSLSAISLSDIALLGAILWALHPIQTQAVTYIVQRVASMSAMFYMIAFYCYIRFRLHKGIFGKIGLIVLVLMFWGLALGSKENTALLPLAILGYEVAFFNFSFWRNRKIFVPVAAFILILFLGMCLLKGVEIFKFLTTAYPNRPFTMEQRLLTEPIILLQYIFLILCPLADYLSIESDIVASTSLITPPVTLASLIIVTGMLIFSLRYLKRFPIICYSIFFYFSNHIVESSFIGLELYFEHRNYLPSVFIYLAVAFYLIRLSLFFQQAQNIFLRNLMIITITVIIVSEGNASYLRNDMYIDEITLLEDAAKKAPLNARPFVSLGAKYLELKQYEKATYNLKKAEDLYNEYPDRYMKRWISLIYYNAGVVNLQQGYDEKALRLLLRSLDIDPTDWETHVNIAYLYFRRKDYKNAARGMYNAVQLVAERPEVYNLLGRTMYAANDYDIAIESFKKGLEIKKTIELQLNLVQAYIKTGNLRLAKSVFFQIPYDNNDDTYLLTRAYLFPGDDRNRSLERVANLMVQWKKDYCKWTKILYENNYMGLIFPDIKGFEDEFRQYYIKISENALYNMSDLIQKAEQCSYIDRVSSDNGN